LPTRSNTGGFVLIFVLNLTGVIRHKICKLFN
jgi:hypothetical protein